MLQGGGLVSRQQEKTPAYSCWAAGSPVAPLGPWRAPSRTPVPPGTSRILVASEMSSLHWGDSQSLAGVWTTLYPCTVLSCRVVVGRGVGA